MKTEHMVTMMAEVDATKLDGLRAQARLSNNVVPSFTALVLKAAALTLQEHPEANRAILGVPFFKRLYQFRNIDVAGAVLKSLPALPGQAFAHPLRKTDSRSVQDLTLELQELVGATADTHEGLRSFMWILKRVPRPFSSWLINAPYWFPTLWVKYRGCGAWVNAPSKAGADAVFTTWPWPVTFSFGMVRKRPVVMGDQVVARLTMPIVMVFDRRIMGGGPAGRVFATFGQILENAAVVDRTDELRTSSPSNASPRQARVVHANSSTPAA